MGRKFKDIKVRVNGKEVKRYKGQGKWEGSLKI